MAIRDFGEGMGAEVRSHIFERGFSSHTDGEKSSGLGLNIVKLIVEAHRGTVGAQSRPGEGSTFTIYIPADKTGEETGKKESGQEETAGHGYDVEYGDGTIF